MKRAKINQNSFLVFLYRNKLSISIRCFSERLVLKSDANHIGTAWNKPNGHDQEICQYWKKIKDEIVIRSSYDDKSGLGQERNLSKFIFNFINSTETFF